LQLAGPGSGGHPDCAQKLVAIAFILQRQQDQVGNGKAGAAPV
jgi:hypothetical protein